MNLSRLPTSAAPTRSGPKFRLSDIWLGNRKLFSTAERPAFEKAFGAIVLASITTHARNPKICAANRIIRTRKE